MDLQFFRPLHEGDSAVASMRLDTTRAAHDADKRIALRWKAVRWKAVRRAPAERNAVEEPPRSGSAVVLPVPDPLDLVIDRDHQSPHVVVAVDREGAGVDAYLAAAHEPSFRRTFHGSTLHITRARAGAEALHGRRRRAAALLNDTSPEGPPDGPARRRRHQRHRREFDRH
ncbi:hypothetical protein [Streptomyces olivaceiscleroticus]|uniref:Uncharacterized protein n=1 Tax=Streptomyces olivaceiscleroticus TaxID=68245 RepID=A0ABP3L5J8_9ACTN